MVIDGRGRYGASVATDEPNGRVKGAPHPLRQIQCGLQDQMLETFPVPVALFYEMTLDPERLRSALAQVLDDFTPFAGVVRRHGPELFVECDNGGVAFTAVESSAQLREALEWLGDTRRFDLVDMIDPRTSRSRGAPALKIKITSFRDGGTCVGACWHHSVGDMQTFMLLLQAWSGAISGQAWRKPVIVEDRDAYFERNVADEAHGIGVRKLGLGEALKFGFYLATSARDRPPIRVYFSPEEIAAMRDAYGAESGARLSMNDVVTAHMGVLVAERDPIRRTRYLSVTVNCRSRVGLPAELFGNFLGSIDVPLEPGASAHATAAEIRRRVDTFAQDYVNLRSSLRFVQENGGARHVRRFIPRALDPMAGNLNTTNWSRFGVGDVTFGSQSPLLFAPIGDAPMPWVSAISDGFANQGAVWSALLPRSIVGALTSPAGRAAIHRFRGPEQLHPLADLGWVS